MINLIQNTVFRLLNLLLRPFGVRLVGHASASTFTMPAAINRIANLRVNIASVLDLGASDGKWSTMALHAFPQATVLGVEPLSEQAAQLTRLCHNEPRFRYAACVAGQVDGATARLQVASDLDGSTVDESSPAGRPVPIRTLDSLAVEHDLKPPYLIKFDTHGFEVPILDGAQAVLANTELVIMEVYNFTISKTALRFHEMCALLESKGFRCYDLADPMLRKHDQAFWQADLFFVRKDHPVFSCNTYA